MSIARPLSAAFREARARAAPGGDGPAARALGDGLEDALVAALARAREAWPEIDLDPARYAAFLGERVDEAALASSRTDDLFATCACAAGDERAIAALEARTFGAVSAALGKMGLARERIDELEQELRRRLFVGDPAAGAPPRIAEYRGSGDLKAWLRVTAMRAAIKQQRREGRERPTDDALLETRAPDDDPELAYMKAAYRAAFKAAFQEALDSLDARERTLLKQQVVDGLGIDELGALYEVHRATAARWLASARDKLLARTRRAFMERARVSGGECESVMRLVQSRLDLSLHRRLAGG